MTSNYYYRASRYFSKSPKEPLATVSMNFENMITPDIEETDEWFMGLLKDIGMMKHEMTNFRLRVTRIFAMLINESQSFAYTKGIIRIGCVCITMAAGFAKAAKLPFDFAEAIAYYLTKNIISLIPARRLLDNKEKLISHFENEDQMIRGTSPETYKRMQAGGCSACNFSLRYEVFLFAQEHHAVAIMNIWDQIFGRLEQLTEIIQCLTVAHIMQVEIPEGCKTATDVVLNTRKWDLEKLISDARQILTHQRSCKQSMCLFFCPKLKSFHGYEVKSEWF